MFFSRRFFYYFFKKKSCCKPQGRIVKADETFIVPGGAAVIPGTYVKKLQNRAADKFCTENPNGIKASPKQDRKAGNSAIDRPDNRGTAVNGKH